MNKTCICHRDKFMGIFSLLSEWSQIAQWKATAVICLLDHTLPQVAKPSKTLQTELLDLSIIPSLVDATLNTLSDAVLPSAKSVLELFDERENLEQVIGEEITNEDIVYFQS